MHTAAQSFAIALAAALGAAALGIGLANRTAAPAADIVKLERVVVVGKRADAMVVAKLPRVVIEGRRTTTADVMVAENPLPAAPV
ncbi:MAG: hypothetical protein DI603_01900 [Roseateles depolymerans]|uniref:Flp pilus assembly protein CpaB n=1 Tax=Roseateles depolymerans TaxID=76731 RepID=A0A2W5E1J0_9BURK|nr:MAG: hypothetical protein DI603_01900 [Roseateles depolymerans]